MANRWIGTPFYYPVNPDPRSIADETWRVAEEAADSIISRIHPTVDAEERRRSVIQYVQDLISSNVRCEVYPYGSVPLKTYLPDGDIDLTVISNINDDGYLARAVEYVLKKEESDSNAEYEVNNIVFIDAEVKLVKCLVDNILIDISFNQLGGLCALSFLEQIDRAIGQDHLLKRSIILIKAWCYFESRILGAYFGLISTYALEMLVLHVFNRYNLAFNGPLEVLYRFMDYFSKFDWETYCLSLNGPASRSSLPDIVVKKPVNGGTEFMLSEEFLRNCVEIFSVPSNGVDTIARAFSLRDLNIIDPLKENNNLGRSVCRGNYHRICCAFKFGSRQLGRALQLPRDEIGDAIAKIFSNTLQKHRPIVRPGLVSRVDDLSLLSLSTNTKIAPEDEEFLEMVKARWDDEDMEEFRDVLILRRTDDEMTYNTPGSKENGTLKNGKFVSVKPKNGFIYRGNGSTSWHYGSCSSSYSQPRDYSLVTGKTCLDFDEEAESSSPLLDLTGDFDGHLRNLLYAQWCTGVSTSLNVPPPQPTPPQWGPVPHGYSYGSSFGPPLQWGPNPHVNSNGAYVGSQPQWGPNPHVNSNGSCSYVELPPQWGPNPHGSSSGSSVGSPRQWASYPRVNSNGAFVGPPAYVARSSPSPVSFGSEQRPKTRGTGTFIPNPLYQRPLVSVRPPMATVSCNAWRNTPRITGLEMQNSEQPVMRKNDRNAEEKLFKLKNEDDFPPLSA